MRANLMSRSYSLKRAFSVKYNSNVPDICRQFYKLIDRNKNNDIVITPYHWPDIDGVAGCYALSELLRKLECKNPRPLISQTPQFEASWVLDKFKIHLNTVEDEYKEQMVILVDVSDPVDIPNLIPTNNVIAVIDHRSYYNNKDFRNAFFCIDTVGSATSLVSLLYKYSSHQPSTVTADLLYLAIMSNTIKCKTHNTTKTDLEAVEWLENFIDINHDFVDEMFIAKSNVRNIYATINDDTSSKLQHINGMKTAVSQLEIISAEQFIHNNYNLILNALNRIKSDRSAESIFLIVIDVKIGWTYLVFIDQSMQHFVTENFETSHNEKFFIIKKIHTRKEIIQTLLNKS